MSCFGASVLRHALALTALSLIVLSFTGCVFKVTHVRQLNEPLAYIPWAGIESQPNSPCSDGALGQADRGCAVALVPGMHVTFHYFAGRAVGQNFQSPGLTSYEWTVPTDRIGPQDYFLFSYFLTSAIPDNRDISGSCSTGAPKCYDPLDGFKNQVAAGAKPEDIVKSSLKSLSLVINHPSSTSSPGTAKLARWWLSDPLASDFSKQNPPDPCTTFWQELIVTPPVGTGGQTVHLSAYRWSLSYFVEEAKGACPDKQLNAWYATSAYPARGYVSLEVPFRITSEMLDRHVPVYWSYQDLENYLNGYRILGFRRDATYLPCEDPHTFCTPQLASMNPKWKRDELLGREGYFTVWFGRARGRFSASKVLKIRSDDKRELLIAPGDLVYVAPGHIHTRTIQVVR